MEHTSYIYILIALLPFLLWGAILFAIYSSKENLQKKPESSDKTDGVYTDNVVIIPYGLIFPIYYRSPTGAQDFG